MLFRSSGSPSVSGLYDFAGICVGRHGDSVWSDGCGYGVSDLAVHFSGRYQIVGLDGFSSDIMPDSFSSVDLVPVVLSEWFYGGGRNTLCDGQLVQSLDRVGRLDVAAALCQTVSERSVYRDSHDGIGSGHDAEKSDVQELT